MSTTIELEKKPVVIKGGASMLAKLDQSSGVAFEGISGVSGSGSVLVEMFKGSLEEGEVDKDYLVTTLAQLLSAMQEKYAKNRLLKLLQAASDEELIAIAKEVYKELNATPKTTLRIDL